MFLTYGFVFYSGYGAQNVGDWVERTDESTMEEITLGCLQSWPTDGGKEEDQHWKLGQHGSDEVTFPLACRLCMLLSRDRCMSPNLSCQVEHISASDWTE